MSSLASSTKQETKEPLGILADSFSIIGTRKRRIDGFSKLSGAALFGEDFNISGVLHGKIFRSTEVHARLLKLDFSRVERIIGVRAIVTSKDFPAVSFGSDIQDQRVLPSDKVVYYGQPICAVAADTPEIAEAAIDEITASYDPLPKILTIEDALKDDSLPIHPDVIAAGYPPYGSKNVASSTRVHRGNVESAFKSSDIILEESYNTQRVHQGYMEPLACTASFDPVLGKIKVWTSTQSPFVIRNTLAHLLSVPVSQIQVIATEVGGGFGGKLSPRLEPLCVMLSKKAGKPVRIVLSREEEFLDGTPRPPISFWIKSGIARGRIVARQGRAIVDTGVFASEGAIYANAAALQLVGPYKIENVDTQGISVYTNKLPCGAYRAPGSMETAFAVESHTDMLAKQAGFDPYVFRMNNLVEDGDMGPTGQILQGVGIKDALKAAAEGIGWKNKEFSENRGDHNHREKVPLSLGIGFACGLIPSIGIHSSGALIKLNEDGKFVLITGAQEIGNGALTGLAMIAAEELGVNLNDIILLNGDTDFVPWDGGAQGSRTTFGGGSAVLSAARDAKSQILAISSRMLKVPEESVRIRDGLIRAEGINNSIGLQDVALFAMYEEGGTILGKGSFVKGFPKYDKNSIEGYVLAPSLPDCTYVAHAAIVVIDRDSGKVDVKKYVAAQDLGIAINPAGVEGQMHGGVAQGIGFSLYEQMAIDEETGLLSNLDFGSYYLPTTGEIPDIETIIVEGHYGGGPYGAKGVGEANIVPPAGAIANAIFAATGARIRSLPLDLEHVRQAVHSNE